MITMISPCQDYINETLSSLSFARRAKKIKNKPKINEEINHKALISQYELQLKNLRNELKKKNDMLKNNLFVKQVEQLNDDKNNIIKQLEETSQLYYRERDEKKKLENKIEILNKDFEKYKKNFNNIDIEQTPQFISVLEKKQNSLLKEFDHKLQEYQKSNKSMNNEEIERYKQLILKQRDMMSTLTQKINERDENIAQLQEDNEAYEKINEQLDSYIFLLNQNFKNLIEFCQQKLKVGDINIENYLNIYKKINNDISQTKNDINKKNQNLDINSSNKTKSINSKKYLPYNYQINSNAPNNLNNNINNSLNSSSISIFNNININSDTPIILLTADEKIKELKGLLKEKENEVNILKLISQKFLSKSCESKDGKIDLEQIKKSFKSGFELHARIRELEEEKQKLKNENEILNEKLSEYQNSLYKIQNIVEDIKLNNLINNNIPSKNESLEKIVDNLNIGQAVDDINRIISNLVNNNIENINNRNNSYISEEIIMKGNKFNSMDRDIMDDKDMIKSFIKDNKNSRNLFNPKIQQIISFNDKNNRLNSDFLVNNTFSLNTNNNEYNANHKIKDINLAKIANSLNNKQLIKKQHKKEGENKFLNKFINADK